MNGSASEEEREIWQRVWGDIGVGTLGFDVEPGDLGHAGSVHLERFSLMVSDRVKGRVVRHAGQRRSVRLPSYAYYVVERSLRPGHSAYGHKKHARRRKIVKRDTRRRFEFGNIAEWYTFNG